MQVTLKKAAALALALGGTTVPILHSYQLDIYGGVPDAGTIANLDAQFKASVEHAIKVTSSVYVLRHLIGEQNEGRINVLLTARAEIDKLLGILNGIPARDRGPSLEALERKVQAAREEKAPAYGRGTGGVALDLETAPFLYPKIRELKKKRLKIEDELAHLNHVTVITIPDDVVELLKELDLV